MKTISFFAALFILSVPVFAAGTGERHVEPVGGFSYCPPKDWAVKEVPGMKYKIAFGPAAGGFASNINVVDESFSGPLSDYVKANVQVLTKMFKGLKNLGQTDFKTDSGLNGVRLIIQSEQQAHLLRQTLFFFDGKGGRKLVVTCSTLAKGGARLDDTFTASMKTFILEK
ncbi:MAG TPA: hypothetical protein VN887_19615 [Candidatus Angelobacter sp.]|nr:hypothetical protein [Candidatus Angelobacter sp.]